MEKAISRLELVDLSKHNFRKTLDSLQEGAHSVLMLMIQWKEIEGYFDSTKTALKERAKELEALEESIKSKSLELEAKEKEIGSIEDSLKAQLSDFEKKEDEFRVEQKAAIERRSQEVEQYERFKQRNKSMEKLYDEKFKELNANLKDLESKMKEVEQQKEEISVGERLRLEFEPLVSLLAKNISSSLTRPASCSTSYLNEKATDLVKKNISLARMIPYLDPGKIVFDAIDGSFKEYLNKDFGEADHIVDSVFNSCIVLLEKLIHMNPKISPKLRQEATQLGLT